MGRSLEKKRILVVEDDYLVAEAVCEVLRDAGAVPIGPVGNAAVALKAALTEDIDGVVLDVKLQGANGCTVADYLRSKNVPFLLITGYDRRVLPPSLQAAAYLSKPALPSDLVEKAAALFSGKKDGSE